LAVLLVVIALFGTSAEHLYKNLQPKWIATAIAVASSPLGLAGVGVGLGGLMILRAKREWLYQRMVGERLRQLHFQTFVCRTNDIIESLQGPTQRDRFLAKRKAWLSEFKLRFPLHAEAEFNALLPSDQVSGVWLHPAPGEPDETLLNALPADFFAAYRALRIEHQRQFADWKLRYGQKILSGFSLRSLEALLAHGSVIATLCLVATEISIVLPLLMNLNPRGAWAHWIAVCFAVAALGMRTLEDGLQPKRELERYRIALQDMLGRFSDTAASASTKFEIMVEVERLAFEEMRDFLRSFYEARFVM
jgi:hypothetical protein